MNVPACYTPRSRVAVRLVCLTPRQRTAAVGWLALVGATLAGLAGALW